MTPLQSPNIILILNDDMGYSDIGCYGGEVETPNLDSLAAGGLRYTQFYNTARCCPSRASLLTGLHPHQADVGHMVDNDEIDGYLGDLSRDSVTIAEALKTGGYKTYMAGKWHVTHDIAPDGDKHNWPCQRGFDDYYGILCGAANYYNPQTLTRNNSPVEVEGEDYFLTDAISEHAVRQIREHAADSSDAPFFQYVAYTAPHWPLHAHEEDIAKYKGRFDAGWDQLRAERIERMKKMGILADGWKLSDRDPDVIPWADSKNQKWQAYRMAVYAAQIDRMDQGIGQILDSLKETGQWENTVIVFLADNGGCAEGINPDPESWRHRSGARLTTRDDRPVRFGNMPEILPGPEDSYCSYGTEWANVSNTPFRRYKHWVHEGGISTPFIMHWPAGIQARGALRHRPAQLPDVMSTFLDVAQVPYPSEYQGHAIQPSEGYSLVPTFSDGSFEREVLYWEHEGNKAVRKGEWKLVCRYPGDWELYNMASGRTETQDLSTQHPEIVEELSALYQAWTDRIGVMDWDELKAIRHAKRG